MITVPFYSQRLTEDNFVSEGFPLLDEALSWSERICGLACLKMAAAHFTATTPTLYSLLQIGLSANAYKPGVGWVHRGIAQLAQTLGMQSECLSIGSDLSLIDRYLRSGALVIVSVSGGFDESKRGGHLVLVLDSTSEEFEVHHPSAWKEYEWPNLAVSREKFQRCMSERGNIIVVTLSKN